MSNLEQKYQSFIQTDFPSSSKFDELDDAFFDLVLIDSEIGILALDLLSGHNTSSRQLPSTSNLKSSLIKIANSPSSANSDAQTYLQYLATLEDLASAIHSEISRP